MSAAGEVKKVLSAQVVLDFPVNINGVEYADLVLRRPVVRDVRIASRVQGSDADQEATLIAQLCDVSSEVIDCLDVADYGKLSVALQNFQNPTLKVAS